MTGQTLILTVGILILLLTMVGSICARNIPLRARRWSMISAALAFVALYAGFVIADILYSPRREIPGTGYTYAVTDSRRKTLYWLALDSAGHGRQFFTVSTPVYHAVKRGDAITIRLRTWSNELDSISIPACGFHWDEREDGGMLATHGFILLPVILALAFTVSRARKAVMSESGQELKS